jgi:hypothetical protein
MTHEEIENLLLYKERSGNIIATSKSDPLDFNTQFLAIDNKVDKKFHSLFAASSLMYQVLTLQIESLNKLNESIDNAELNKVFNSMKIGCEKAQELARIGIDEVRENLTAEIITIDFK